MSESGPSSGGASEAPEVVVEKGRGLSPIWLIPIVRDAVGWDWAFVLLVPGPALGVAAMIRLRRSPYASAIAGGLG